MVQMEEGKDIKKEDKKKVKFIKSERLEIRLTKKEKEKIKLAASKIGLPISEYARRILLEGKVVVLSEEEKRTITGIGRNFNQLVRLANSQNSIPNAITKELRGIISKLKKHY